LSSAPADISTQSYGTFDHVQITETSPTSIRERKPNSRESSISSPSRQKPFTKSVAMLIAALGMQVSHSAAPHVLHSNQTQIHVPFHDI
jgi:hypothetical protein